VEAKRWPAAAIRIVHGGRACAHRLRASLASGA
jgi:hypothetical protein